MSGARGGAWACCGIHHITRVARGLLGERGGGDRHHQRTGDPREKSDLRGRNETRPKPHPDRTQAPPGIPPGLLLLKCPPRCANRRAGAPALHVGRKGRGRQASRMAAYHTANTQAARPPVDLQPPSSPPSGPTGPKSCPAARLCSYPERASRSSVGRRPAPCLRSARRTGDGPRRLPLSGHHPAPPFATTPPTVIT